KNFAAGVDLRFNLNSKRRVSDVAAGGVYFSSDKVGPYSFSNTTIGLSGAYHKILDPKNNTVLSGGFNFAISQRNLNYEQITFEDQFNGIDGYVFPTNEDLPVNNFVYGDLGVGVHISSSPKKANGFFLGASLLHVNRPELSFYKRDDDPAQQENLSAKMYTRFNISGGARFYLSEDLQLIPRAMLAFQGPHIYGNIGTTARIEVPAFNNNALHLGINLLPAFGEERSFTLEAIGAQIGFEVQHMVIGLSYDHSLTDIIDYRTAQGAFEISISYFGNYENDNDNFCPVF
ncbi:MAG: type IX secretion system membrane protein PorP/SprF, partial [Saprospiraceae bacterium]